MKLNAAQDGLAVLCTSDEDEEVVSSLELNPLTTTSGKPSQPMTAQRDD